MRPFNTAPNQSGHWRDSLLWRKASFCQNGECIELAAYKGGIIIRTRPDAGHILATKAELVSFIRGAKAGEFDDLIMLSAASGQIEKQYPDSQIRPTLPTKPPSTLLRGPAWPKTQAGPAGRGYALNLKWLHRSPALTSHREISARIAPRVTVTAELTCVILVFVSVAILARAKSRESVEAEGIASSIGQRQGDVPFRR